jgi:hypothetical protein
MLKLPRRIALIAFAAALAIAGIACRGTGLTVVGVPECTSCVAARVQPALATRQALAQEIRSRLASEGGCTLDPRTARPVGAIDAYAVSRAEYELRLAELPTTGQIEEYLGRHADVLASEHVYVGAWRDDATGAHYLDISELVRDRATAEARGRAERQRCIYHLATGSEIRLN